MEKVSGRTEAFLDYLREAAERQRAAESERQEAEAETQDILHALELERHGYRDRARLALKLQRVRRKRRGAKDTLAWTAPVTAWAKENQGAVRSLERLLGELRRVERQAENRMYTPRTRILEDPEPPPGEERVTTTVKNHENRKGGASR